MSLIPHKRSQPACSLRGAADEDYAAMVAVHNRCHPDYPDSVGEWRQQDRAIAGRYVSRRVVAEAGGAVVGYGHLDEFRESRVGRFVIDIRVLPEYRRRGIGGVLHDRLVSLAGDHGARSLLAGTWEDQPEAIRFLERRGFQLTMRGAVSCIEPARFDDAVAERALRRLDGGPVRIAPLADLQPQEPDWMRRLYDLCTAVDRDMPSIDPYEPQPFEVRRAFYESRELFDPAGWFIAVDGAQWMGVTGLRLRPADPGTLFTAITGVLRSHRRRGIATALKAQSIRWARARGFTRIDTDNEENNPMYRINLHLGFEPRPAELAYTREMS